MRLVFCLFKYFPYGGMQADFLQAAKACQARGHQVQVFTMSWDGEMPAELKVEVIKIKGFSNHGRYRAFAQAVAQRLVDHPADAVIGFNKIPGLDFYFAADPCFVERAKRTRSKLVCWLSPRHRLLAALERSVFGREPAVKIFYLSEKEKQKFLDVYHTPEDRFILLPPGIERKKLCLLDVDQIRASKRAEIAVHETTKVILFVGSGFKIKGLDRAITALANLPQALRQQAKLLVVGDANPAPYLHLIEQQGVSEHVQFLGGRSDVGELLQAADCLLHPARNETGGKVLLEAAASGLPVITTAACGFSPYIANAQLGYVLAEPFQPEKLQQALMDCLDNINRQHWQQQAAQWRQEANIFGLADEFVKHVESWWAAK